MIMIVTIVTVINISHHSVHAPPHYVLLYTRTMSKSLLFYTWEFYSVLVAVLYNNYVCSAQTGVALTCVGGWICVMLENRREALR